MTTSIIRLAVDIGGTFTDIVLASGDRLIASAKVLTTHDDPSAGAFAGVQQLLGDAGLDLSDVTGFIHGTTLATNALLERRGARVSTITTEGFRDILEIAYERRYAQYDIDLDKPDYLVPRDRRFTIAERCDAKGNVLHPLADDQIVGIADQLVAAQTESVAVCLLHAYANPAHEQVLRNELQRLLPQIPVSISSAISPEAREFERLCTTVANAYVQPLMAAYLERFEQRFREAGLTCAILMMTASGGMTTVASARECPIRLVESGPAGGAILASRVASARQADEVLSFDMGGTTAKLCLIDRAQPQTSRQFEIARAARFIKGSGMPVRIPVIDMIEIGAGGGSIASVDRLGRIAVGPESAGSDPGPAAFGGGGQRATVTDADVVLGLISPELFAEGRLVVDAVLAEQALLTDVGEPLGYPADAAANGVSQIVDENMASAARMHAVESGKDLGQRVMVAFGGNGPLHATRVARRAGVRRILIPPDPGVGSAVGFLFAPVSFEIVRSHYCLLEDMDMAAINELFEQLIEDASEVVRAGAPGQALSVQRRAFVRYRGQGHEIEIALPDRAMMETDIATIRDAFETEYIRQFRRAVPDMVIEVLNWSARVSGPESALQGGRQNMRASPATTGSTTIHCEITGRRCTAAVIDRAALQRGVTIDGPALITESQTTTYVSADFTATKLNDGYLLLIQSDQGRDL